MSAFRHRIGLMDIPHTRLAGEFSSTDAGFWDRSRFDTIAATAAGIKMAQPAIGRVELAKQIFESFGGGSYCDGSE
jgi:hypothetical protein